MPTAPASRATTRLISPLWNSLALDRDAKQPLQDQIVGYFRAAVLDGRLKAGARVPSSRALALEHGVSRVTAVQAYDRLVAEGYLVARPGAGLFVADSVPDDHLLPAPARPPARPRITRPAPAEPAFSLPRRPLDVLPLSVGIPALDQFPWSDWARLSARVHRSRPADLLGYGDARGEPALRTAIAEYLGAARGIACTPDQVLVVAGAQQGIALTARVLSKPGDTAWVEEPGYPLGRVALAAAGLSLAPVPVDDEGIDAGAGARIASRARLALVTPSHQYPLGALMSLRRRLALLDWADAADAWIIEDDYDGEYRYEGRPLAPLYTLDRADRVLYLGTFSKVLAPGLRLGYLVVPPDLVERFTTLKAAADRHAPRLPQQVLAAFVAEGRLAAHLRRMRTLYARRRGALLDALAREAAGRLIAGDAPQAGLHLVARLQDARDDAAITERALAARVHAAPLSSFYNGAPRVRGFVLGFAGTPEREMAPAVRRLVKAIDA
ncbi:MAG: PLP-dependent aminotransferase family protein [Alphaproteobacteria bacterium]|nr:PLP-dependent aminotransferase family protein [Alphaproteobacteria bacterium]